MALSTESADGSSTRRRIVLVIGPGRSGTSTVAGALARCGLEVPGKSIGGNPTNPSGFYEPRWVVDFHREVLKRHHVGTIDPAPEALDIVSASMQRSTERDRLRTWLGERLEEQPRLVVKDPRSIWFQRAWIELAHELDAEPGFVTMLRHPAQVSASRRTYYGRGDSTVSRPQEVERIAGWVNGLLTAELVTRDSPRVFVSYSSLVADWRTQLGRVGEALDLPLEPDIAQEPHPVDDFIDPKLHRIDVDWTDVDVPNALRDVAEQVWQTLSAAAEKGEPADLSAEVDRLRAGYAMLLDDAQALTRSATVRARRTARRRGAASARAEIAEAVATDVSLSSRLRSLLTRGKA